MPTTKFESFLRAEFARLAKTIRKFNIGGE
jgi:hypothetical protein